jgi:hypothetical protein
MERRSHQDHLAAMCVYAMLRRDVQLFVMVIMAPCSYFSHPFASCFLAYTLSLDSNFGLVHHGQSNTSGSNTMTDLSIKASPSLFQLTIGDTGFLINNDGHQLIWIPAHLRGQAISVHLSTCSVVVGGTNGAVTIISFLL